MEMENNNSQTGHEEKEKALQSQVSEVRSIMKEQHGQEIPPECDEFAARCVRLKDGNMEKTIKLMLGFQTAIADIAAWGIILQPSLPYFEYVCNSLLVTPFQRKDSQGRHVLLIRFNLWDPQKVTFDECVVAVWMLSQHFHTQNIEAQEKGYITILDFSNFTLQQAWAVKQWRLISLVKWASNGIMGRVKGIHVVFHSRIIRAIYAAVKPFLKEKLKKRIFFHDKVESLHQHCDCSILPSYLGGDLDIDGDECVDKAFIKDMLLQDPYFKDVMMKPFPCK